MARQNGSFDGLSFDEAVFDISWVNDLWGTRASDTGWTGPDYSGAIWDDPGSIGNWTDSADE